MKKVNYQRILRLKEELRRLNEGHLNEIEWTNDLGEDIKIPIEILDEFRFTGLNNSDFVECHQDGFECKTFKSLLKDKCV